MTAAWLLTALAMVGVIAGTSLGQSRALSVRLAAAGGGLLSGMSLFWLMPEMAQTTGWSIAVLAPIAVCGSLSFSHNYLAHTGHSLRHGMIAPLLTATALHCFLDGWSVRALAVQPVANIAAPFGLALHKLPEGLALGWITRKSVKSAGRTIASCCAVELLTIAGAWLEPRVDRSGTAAFGARWTAAVLIVVAGSFLFLGVHTVVPDRKKTGVVPIFSCSLAVVALIAWLKFNPV